VPRTPSQRKRPLFDKLLSRIVLEVGADGSTQLRLTAASTTSATRRAGDPATTAGAAGSSTGGTSGKPHGATAAAPSGTLSAGGSTASSVTGHTATGSGAPSGSLSAGARGPLTSPIQTGGPGRDGRPAGAGLSPVRNARKGAPGPSGSLSASQSLGSPGGFGRSPGPSHGHSLTSRPGHASTTALQRPGVRHGRVITRLVFGDA
jgi:hypothetical protein